MKLDIRQHRIHPAQSNQQRLDDVPDMLMSLLFVKEASDNFVSSTRVKSKRSLKF